MFPHWTLGDGRFRNPVEPDLRSCYMLTNSRNGLPIYNARCPGSTISHDSKLQVYAVERRLFLYSRNADLERPILARTGCLSSFPFHSGPSLKEKTCSPQGITGGTQRHQGAACVLRSEKYRNIGECIAPYGLLAHLICHAVYPKTLS